MDKTIELILQSFTHLAREIQVYCIGGTIMILNIFFIDFIYYGGWLWMQISTKAYILPLFILAYAVGHVCRAVYYVFFEKIRSVRDCIKLMLNFKYKPVDDKELQPLYKKDKERYMFFVERKHILFNIRCVLCISFFISALAISIYLCHCCTISAVLIAVFDFLSFLFLFVLTFETEEMYKENIDTLKIDGKIY